MPRGVKATVDYHDIASRRAKLEAELAELAKAEKTAREAERDKGRTMLLTALGKVKIGAMERGDAQIIARSIETLGAAQIAAKLTT